MSLYQVSSGSTINANDVNQLVNNAQQPSGGQENIAYFLTGMGTSGITALGSWVPSQSRTSTPVSVSINTSVQSPTNCTTPSTFHLSSFGFQLACQFTATGSAANAGGTGVIQF
jgi:hypothetical protein